MGVVSSKCTVKEVKVTQPPFDRTESDRESDRALDMETVQLPVKPVDTILEKVDAKHETNKSNMPITEAEKMRELYRKERRTSEHSDGKGTIKKDAENNKGRQQYKTSVYHETGRQAEPPKAVDTTSKADDTVIPKLDLSSTQTDGNDDDQGPTSGEKVKNIDISVRSPVKLTAKSTKKSSKKNKKSILLTRDSDGSLLSNAFSQHCPGLLEQKRSVDSSLKPLAVPRSNQVRSELETQGFLTPETRASIAQVDPKQEGIIGELRQMGIIQKVTSDDVYTMSDGLPKRRPPPRLCHLPPPTKTDSDSPKSSKTVLKKKSSLIDKLLSKDAEKPKEVAPEGENTDTTDSEYFSTLCTENVGDAEKLKLKLIDVDML